MAGGFTPKKRLAMAAKFTPLLSSVINEGKIALY
jgi:hypothetical protein